MCVRKFVDVFVQVCMHLCQLVYVYVCKYVYVRLYVCVCVCVCVCDFPLMSNYLKMIYRFKDTENIQKHLMKWNVFQKIDDNKSNSEEHPYW